MREVWLRPNRRALFAGMVLPALVAAGGVAAALASEAVWLRAFGAAIALLAALLIGGLAWQASQPRLGYEPGLLCVYLRLGRPIRVPVELIECCFMGAGPLKLTDAGQSNLKTANLIIRLADRAPEWANVAVKPALGKWADGYIMIHGTWCEPLSLELLQRINTRLHEIQHSAAVSS